MQQISNNQLQCVLVSPYAGDRPAATAIAHAVAHGDPTSAFFAIACAATSYVHDQNPLIGFPRCQHVWLVI